ncbi:unnamed protein product [Meganyctiphanes norvegica]|uniref:Uncharacterized protein n=1 Tax=Meganyctiphanes norvegica TaxID=48144 RepID=A0AAV2RNN3_MEGNR
MSSCNDGKMSTLVVFSDVSGSSSEEEYQPYHLRNYDNFLNSTDDDSETLSQTATHTTHNRTMDKNHPVYQSVCSRRPWCSRETRKSATQLILLCITSCSWTLLLISLTLTTPQQHMNRRRTQEVTPAPRWNGNTADACGECLAAKGPPKAYWQTFGKPLQQIAEALERLERPLAPPALRAHLAGTHALLRRLAEVLHLPQANKKEGNVVELGDPNEVLKMAGDPLSSGLACPERFLGTRAGYPRYNIGFVPITCPSRPIAESVTLLMWDISPDNIPQLLAGIWKQHPGLRVLLVSADIKQFGKSLLTEAPRPSLAAAVKRLLQRVTTPYVLLAPGLKDFNQHTRLERLLWVAEETGLWAIGGSARGADGRWRAGCLQAQEAAGQLLYNRGYTHSLHECQLCNALETPMLIRRDSLSKLPWPRESIPADLLMPELFLSINGDDPSYKHGVATCPDSMFEVSVLEPLWVGGNITHSGGDKSSKDRKAAWEKIARKHGLGMVQLPSGDILHFHCKFLHPKHITYVDKIDIYAIPHKSPLWRCMQLRVTEMLEMVLHTCEDLDITCFLSNYDANVVLSSGSDDLWGLQHGRELHLQVNELTSLLFLHSNLRNNTLIHVQQSNYARLNITFDGSVVRVIGNWWTIFISVRETPLDTLWLRLELLGAKLWVAFSTNSVYKISSEISSLPELQHNGIQDTDLNILNR